MATASVRASVAAAAARPVQAARPALAKAATTRAAARALYFHVRPSFRVFAAEVEEAADEDPAVEEAVEEEADNAYNEDWAAEKLAQLAAAEAQQADEARFSLNFLWLEKNVAVAIDQVFSKGQRSPVTEFFFWPRNDAWEELKAALDQRPWISERDKVLLLNRCTEVINYWQDDTKHSLAEAAAKFEDCKFQGS